MLMRLLTGLWVCLVALGASFGAMQWKSKESAAQAAAAAAPVRKPSELRKLKPITVPLVARGAVQGYAVAQLAYLAEGEKLKGLDISPDAFVMDEAFRLLYSDEKLDFKHLDRFDLVSFSRAVKNGVAIRLKSDVVEDVLVQEFNFIGAEEVRR
jgi:flagellar basal body-associated protein FliL